MSCDKTPPPLHIVDSTDSSNSQKDGETESEVNSGVLTVLSRVIRDVSLHVDLTHNFNFEAEQPKETQPVPSPTKAQENTANKQKVTKMKVVDLPFGDREFPPVDGGRSCSSKVSGILSQAMVEEILVTHQRGPQRMDEEDVIDKVAAVGLILTYGSYIPPCFNA